MKREEFWRNLIDADINVEYFAGISNICRWIDSLVRVTLLVACGGSIMALTAKQEWQPVLAWISFIAAVIEVVIKPVMNWNALGNRARLWRCAWIDLRAEFERRWRANFESRLSGDVDVDDLVARVIDLEKSEGYFPKIQWIVNRLGRKAERRRGASRKQDS